MAGTVSAGSIVYEVDIDTARLIQGRRDIDAALNGLNNGMGRLEASVNRTERSVANMDRAMSSLSGVARGLLAALSVQQVASYADAWTTLNNKLANAVRPQEELVDVTTRVFEITQQTRSSLDATATLYARLERGTREYNTSAADLARLTTIINQGFVVSGATAQEAENAIIQLSQGIASGVLRGEEFNSVAEQGSRLMVALADSLGVGIGQLRAMAAEGKLTTDVVVNGLLSQGDQIGKEFANTVTTISQAMQTAGNNITKFFGENATVKSFVSVFNDSIVSVSENLDSLSTALLGAAVIMGGRYAGAFAMATAAQATHLKSTIQGIVATRQSAQQEAAAASVVARKAAADKDAALSALNLATAEYNVAKGSAAEAFALENLIRLRGIYIQTSATAAVANNTLSASQARVAATGFTLANTMKAINVATSPLGGPIGVIAIVAAGWYLYSQRQQEARRESIAFADSLPQVISRLKEMNLIQAQGVRADTVESINAQKEEITELGKELANLSNRYKDAKAAADNSTEGQWLNNDATETAADLANKIAKARRDLDGKTATLNQTQEALRLINIQVNEGIVDQMKAARDNALATAEAEKQASFLGGTQSFLAMKLGQTTEKLKEFNSEALKIDWGGKEGEKLIKQAERRLALSKAEGAARAELQATFDAEDAGIADEIAIARLQDVYVKTQQATEAKKEKNKEDRAAESASKKAASAAESDAQKLQKLKEASELAADSTDQLSRAQAILNAQNSLSKNASPEMIKQAGEYAAKKWDTANAIKAQAAAEKLLPESRENARYQEDVRDLETALSAKKISQEQYNDTLEQLEKQHQVNLAKIRADQAVTPQMEAEGSVDPVTQLANENARKLALIQQFEADKTITEQQAIALRNAANTQYEQQRIAAQWEIYRNQSEGNELLASSLEGLQGGASNALTGLINGTQSLQEAMANVGSTILNSVISSLVEMGIQWAKNQLMGQAAAAASLTTTMAQATAAASAWAPAAMSASIATYGSAAAVGQTAYAESLLAAKGLAVAGAREHGGPVSANSMYRVGEGGKPEIFKASNGSQYMIPGDNGRVISNRDMQGGGSGVGGVVQHITFEINTTGGIDQATIKQMEGMMKRVALFQINDQANRPNGMIQPRTKR
ncbi:tape measure protein [Atlantibacter hermannii]|uniref:tape measure protein n=1 Tax=Atlantibacter hermannii TaxID=565 RepID=UPI0028A74E17|nr:tape measure protein [Atlantibacter hermannii]